MHPVIVSSTRPQAKLPDHPVAHGACGSPPIPFLHMIAMGLPSSVVLGVGPSARLASNPVSSRDALWSLLAVYRPYVYAWLRLLMLYSGMDRN